MLDFLKMLGMGIGLLIASSIILWVWTAVIATTIANVYIIYLLKIRTLVIPDNSKKGETNE